MQGDLGENDQFNSSNFVGSKLYVEKKSLLDIRTFGTRHLAKSTASENIRHGALPTFFDEGSTRPWEVPEIDLLSLRLVTEQHNTMTGKRQHSVENVRPMRAYVRMQKNECK